MHSQYKNKGLWKTLTIDAHSLQLGSMIYSTSNCRKKGDWNNDKMPTLHFDDNAVTVVARGWITRNGIEYNSVQRRRYRNGPVFKVIRGNLPFRYRFKF